MTMATAKTVDTTYEIVGLGAALDAAGVTQSEFAEAAGVARAYLWRTLKVCRVRGEIASRYFEACRALGVKIAIDTVKPERKRGAR